MRFIDSYKQLEKLCNEIYNDNHGVSAYINDMQNKTQGSGLVRGWDADLKQLKHYRRIRNQIVHEPNCTEENMCELRDAEWVEDFYSRIMSGNDPLTLYRKARNSQVAQKSKQTISTEYTYPGRKYQAPKPAGCLTYLAGILLVATVMAWVVNML